MLTTSAALPVWFVLLPLLGAGLIVLAPAMRVRVTALGVALATALVAGLAAVLAGIHGGHAMQFETNIPLIPAWGFSFHLGVDGLSAAMLALCGVIEVIAVLSSWKVDKRPRAYFALLMLLFAGTNAVFVSLDLLLFYVGWELMLIPMYILIAVWGGDQRRYAAVKYVLFTLVGSLAMLFALILLPASVPEEGVLVEVDPDRVMTEAHIGPTSLEWYPPSAFSHPVVGNGLLWVKNKTGFPSMNLKRNDLPVDIYGLPLLIERNRSFTPVQVVHLKLEELKFRGRKKFGDHPPSMSQFAGDSKNDNLDLKASKFFVLVPRDLNIQHLQLLWPHWAKTTFLGVSVAVLGFWCFLLAFAVKVPVIGLHTWLPHAHVQAPTAISVVLAALLLKLGVYGFLRIAWPVFPTAALDAGPLIAVLGTVAILYAAWVALMQNDLKRLVAYSSVSHMGFCLLGLAAVNVAGATGAVVQMVTHGLGSAMLFLVVGVIYERAHHRRVDGFGGLAKPMPVFAGIALFACLASAALPGLAGFPGELLVFLGAVSSTAANGKVQILGLVSCLGVIITAAYLLWMVKRVFFGPIRHPEQAAWPDLTRREYACLVPLVLLTLAVGVWPQPLIDSITPAAETLVRHLHWVAATR